MLLHRTCVYISPVTQVSPASIIYQRRRLPRALPSPSSISTGVCWINPRACYCAHINIQITISREFSGFSEKK
ncbi:unnamed protein product [Urochloa humidicola]